MTTKATTKAELEKIVTSFTDFASCLYVHGKQYPRNTCPLEWIKAWYGYTTKEESVVRERADRLERAIHDLEDERDRLNAEIEETKVKAFDMLLAASLEVKL